MVEDIRLVLKYAVEMGYIKINPCYFKKKELNAERKRMDLDDPYTVPEMDRIRKSALKLCKKDKRSYTSCLSIIACQNIGGRSKAEIFNLQWDQVNMINRTIRYERTKNDEPETKNFGASAAAVFRVMLSIRHKTNHRDGRYKYVFPTSSNVAAVKHIQDPRKTFKNICKDAGVKLKPIHFLRHSWATGSEEALQNIKALKEIGGWKDLKSVEIYVKYNAKRKKAGINKIDKFFKSHAS